MGALRIACAAVVALAACSRTPSGSGNTGGTDAGQIDAGQIDAGQGDGGQPDAGQPDAGQPDAGQPDAGQPDAGQPDAGQPDAGTAVHAASGPTLHVGLGAHVTLDGTRSTGDIATWSWAQSAGPAVALSGANTARPSFDAPQTAAVLSFTLTVNGADSATQSVVVRVPPAIVPATPVGKIRAAMETGALDRDTAAQYLAFAVFSDPRLPPEYAGTEREPSGSGAMHIVAQEYPTLSPQAQAVVRPFLLPPYSPQSWYAQRGSQQLRAAAPAAVEWLGAIRAHVAVWYQSTLANGADTAGKLADEIEAKIWPRLIEIWSAGHQPWTSDPDVAAADIDPGVVGKLNISLVPALVDADGVEIPYHGAPSLAHIQILQDLPFTGTPGLIEVAAHELTHACQDTFKQSEPYASATWLYEGIAVWGEDAVYPRHDSEHRYAKAMLDTMIYSLDDSLGTRAYGTYLFFQYVTDAVDDQAYVRRVFESFGTKSALESIDAAFSDGSHVRDHWGDFLAAAWNRGPTGWFRQDDRLEDEAKPDDVQTVSPSPDGPFPFDAGANWLSGRYHHVVFGGEARVIRFWDGLRWKLDVFEDERGNQQYQRSAISDALRRDRVTRVLVKKDGAWKQWYPGVYDGSENPPGACRDAIDERYDEAVFIFGDGSAEFPHQVSAPNLWPRLWASNAGCFRWTGSASVSRKDGEVDIRVSANSRWDRWGVELGRFLLRHDDGDWTASGTFGLSNWTCTAAGSGSWSTDYGLYDHQQWLGADVETIAGPDARSFDGTETGPAVTYHVVCKDSQGAIQKEYDQSTWGSPFAYDPWCDDEEQPLPKLGGDGVTAQGSYACHETSYSWGFTASPEE